MKQKFCILLSLLLSFSLAAGCGKGSSAEISQNEVSAEAPTILDLTMREDVTFENVNGVFVETRSDFPELGYPDWDGEMIQADTFPALAETLSAVNEDLLFRQISEHKNLMETAFYSSDEEIYFRSDTYVTRNDSLAVSFYHHIDYYDGYGGQEWLTMNIDTETGQELHLQDVFTDLDALSSALSEELLEKYPYLGKASSLEEMIDTMVWEEMGINFALSYGVIHFFFQEYTLPVSIDGHQVVLSLEEYSELVKEEYRIFPERYMLQLEYAVDYVTEDGHWLNMGWLMNGEWSESVLWSMLVDENIYTEELYGYAPQNCYLIHTENGDYIYLQKPAGDISKMTDIYQVTDDSLKKIGELPLAMHSRVNLNPDRLLLDINDMLFADGIMLMPYGIYRVGSDGMPVLLENTFGVTGTDMIGKETFRIYMTDLKDATIEEGFTTIAQGLPLTPFRTDMETYLDCITEDGRAIRLTIDGWNDEMNIHGFGTLKEGFEAFMNQSYE